MAVVERVGREREARPEERGGGCTLEEAVVVGRQWERTETVGLRKGEVPAKKSPARGGQKGGGRDRAESERR